MKSRIRTLMGVIGALGLLSTLSGCIFVERGGHGHCDIGPAFRVCDAGFHSRR
jgi:hypothetical protein